MPLNSTQIKKIRTLHRTPARRLPSTCNELTRLLPVTPDSRTQATELCGNSTHEKSTNIIEYTVKRTEPESHHCQTHMLNVRIRHSRKNESPELAAADFILHYPFRCVDDILEGKQLTKRLGDILTQSDKFPQFVKYIERVTSNTTFTNFSCPGHVSNINIPAAPQGEPERADTGSDSDLSVDELQPDEALQELAPCTAANSDTDPAVITRVWENHSPDYSNLDLSLHKEYINYCQKVGTRAADTKFATDTDELNIPTLSEPSVEIDGNNHRNSNSYSAIDISELKRNLLDGCLNNEQRDWLSSVISYFQVYYNLFEAGFPDTHKQICSQNHIILTNAPGGCGKSWLIAQLSHF